MRSGTVYFKVNIKIVPKNAKIFPYNSSPKYSKLAPKSKNCSQIFEIKPKKCDEKIRFLGIILFFEKL